MVSECVPTNRGLYGLALDSDPRFPFYQISKEIEEFVSGKDPKYAWDRANRTDALTPEQQQILKQRGVLSPDQIHGLATKTRNAVVPSAGSGRSEGEIALRATCHSDYVDEEEAKKIQAEKLVQVDVRPVLNIRKNDPVI